ncbi:MAG: diguanylate cyclase [Kiritimatiellia bacterium]|nr:diguanylate cyclase [Kiritimatiellia bacterium]
MPETERRQTSGLDRVPAMAAADESPDTTTLLKQLRKLAYQDPLTGLLNRRGFDEELRRLWNLDDAQAFPLGLLIIDIDHFKTINDSFGHFVGDQVLKECAQRMQASVREDDLVCRYYGGDEMVVLLPRASRAEAQAAADRLLEKFRGEVICKGSYDLRMTISIGACHIPAPVDPTGDRFLIQADRALYRAKQSGRNRACFADDLPDPISDTNGAAHPVAPAGMADTRRTVLVADDDLDVCRYFERVLTRDQFSVLMAHNGAEAIALLKQATGMVDVALIDLRLGEEDGLDLLKQLLALDSSIIGVIITGAATVDDAVGALRMGAYDFIQKPIASGQLTAVLERATKYRRLVLENKRYQLHLEDMVRENNAALSRALDNISDTFQFTLEAITDILDVREHQTGEHSRRVARLAIVLAREMGAWPEDIQTIETGALLHDIGKIGVPDSILLKPGPLTPDERAIMDRHPHIGYNIIKAGPGLEEVSEIVLAHQERYDGSGYPLGLKGDAICLGARIFAVIDTYDAIRTDRPYSAGRSAEVALDEILRHKGTLFDPTVVEALQRCHAEIEKVGHWNPPVLPAPE